MTRTAFKALAWQLTLRGVPYVRPDLGTLVESLWPLAEAKQANATGAQRLGRRST
jgi:hypothetical protein